MEGCGLPPRPCSWPSQASQVSCVSRHNSPGQRLLICETRLCHRLPLRGALRRLDAEPLRATQGGAKGHGEQRRGHGEWARARSLQLDCLGQATCFRSADCCPGQATCFRSADCYPGQATCFCSADCCPGQATCFRSADCCLSLLSERWHAGPSAPHSQTVNARPSRNAFPDHTWQSSLPRARQLCVCVPSRYLAPCEPSLTII